MQQISAAASFNTPSLHRDLSYATRAHSWHASRANESAQTSLKLEDKVDSLDPDWLELFRRFGRGSIALHRGRFDGRLATSGLAAFVWTPF